MFLNFKSVDEDHAMCLNSFRKSYKVDLKLGLFCKAIIAEINNEHTRGVRISKLKINQNKK